MTGSPGDVAALIAAVEPGEAPAVTAEREAREELGIEADFSIAGLSFSTRGSSPGGAGGPGRSWTPRTRRGSTRT